MKGLAGIVLDVFEITGRGCVVVHGPPGDPGLRLRTGDGVLLKRPDGSEIRTTVRGTSMGNGDPDSLLADIRREDVPLGTEIWLV
jgi:hypothetical protein